MRLEVRASEVVVLLQRHGRVEAALGLVHDEEVSQDEVLLAELLGVERMAHVPKRIDAAKLWPRFALGHAPHLRKDELGGRHRGDLVSLCALRCCIRLRQRLLLVVAGVVVPPGDVVADLHTDLAHGGGILQRQIPRRDQLPSDDGRQAQALVALEAGLIDVPRGLDAHGLELRLHVEHVFDTLWCVGTPRGNHAEVEDVAAWELRTLALVEASKELGVGLRARCMRVGDRLPEGGPAASDILRLRSVQALQHQARALGARLRGRLGGEVGAESLAQLCFDPVSADGAACDLRAVHHLQARVLLHHLLQRGAALPQRHPRERPAVQHQDIEDRHSRRCHPGLCSRCLGLLRRLRGRRLLVGRRLASRGLLRRLGLITRRALRLGLPAPGRLHEHGLQHAVGRTL
mmetsp:Transcript_82320/g.245488  ORF Transcript_82320/g.245488 Transcript_82320/m.245488 type:complete len:404 (-) Transcript_82320:1420-2631(-)